MTFREQMGCRCKTNFCCNLNHNLHCTACRIRRNKNTHSDLSKSVKNIENRKTHGNAFKHCHRDQQEHTTEDHLTRLESNPSTSEDDTYNDTPIDSFCQ